MSIEQVLERLDNCIKKVGRKESEIELVPVSKGHSIEAIQVALRHERFPRCLAENRLLELKEKKKILGRNIVWHYLGVLQSRKISEIFTTAQVVHSVSRIKELESISTLEFKNQIRFYLQFNISQEKTKSGFRIDEFTLVMDKVKELKLEPNVLGLMGMAAPLSVVGEKEVRKQFASLRKLRDLGFSAAGLSMGMSADFEIAVQEGSTCIRVGSSLFGPRG